MGTSTFARVHGGARDRAREGAHGRAARPHLPARLRRHDGDRRGAAHREGRAGLERRGVRARRHRALGDPGRGDGGRRAHHRRRHSTRGSSSSRRPFGATDFVEPEGGARRRRPRSSSLTDGGVDYSFECIGNVDVMGQALACTQRGWGQSIVIGVAGAGQEIHARPFLLVTGRSWRGTAFGGTKGRTQLPRFVDRYMSGRIKLDEMVTARAAARAHQRGLRPHARGRRDPHGHQVPMKPADDPTVDYRKLVRDGYDRCAPDFAAARARRGAPGSSSCCRGSRPARACSTSAAARACRSRPARARARGDRRRLLVPRSSASRARTCRRREFVEAGPDGASSFAPASFDAVVVVLRDLPPAARGARASCCAAIARWLAPGGHLLATVHALREDAYTEDGFFGVRDVLEQLGARRLRADARDARLRAARHASLGHGYSDGEPRRSSPTRCCSRGRPLADQRRAPSADARGGARKRRASGARSEPKASEVDPSVAEDRSDR